MASVISSAALCAWPPPQIYDSELMAAPSPPLPVSPHSPSLAAWRPPPHRRYAPPTLLVCVVGNGEELLGSGLRSELQPSRSDGFCSTSGGERHYCRAWPPSQRGETQKRRRSSAAAARSFASCSRRIQLATFCEAQEAVKRRCHRELAVTPPRTAINRPACATLPPAGRRRVCGGAWKELLEQVLVGTISHGPTSDGASFVLPPHARFPPPPGC